MCDLVRCFELGAAEPGRLGVGITVFETSRCQVALLQLVMQVASYCVTVDAIPAYSARMVACTRHHRGAMWGVGLLCILGIALIVPAIATSIGGVTSYALWLIVITLCVCVPLVALLLLACLHHYDPSPLHIATTTFMASSLQTSLPSFLLGRETLQLHGSLAVLMRRYLLRVQVNGCGEGWEE